MPGPAGTGPLPTFIVAGTQRSGTTALWHWLQAHPEVFMAPHKELHYFDTRYPSGVAAYRHEFADWAGQPAIGEATPNYAYYPEAMARMVELLPDVRLIISAREPVERAYSQYWARRSRAVETREFAEVIEAEPIDPTEEPGGGHLMARGRYMTQIQAILELVPRDQLHVVLFDDIEQEPVATFGQICRFIGVDDLVVPAEVGRPANGHRQFRSQRVRRLTLRLPGRAADAVGRLNSRSADYPAMDPGLRRELAERFRPDNQALADWLGRDLSSWLD